MTQEPGGPSLDGAAAQALAERLHGTLIRPTDDDYESARRVWNAGVDRHPAAIVRASDSGDVIQAIGFARDHDLPIAVRGGGHSAAGFGTGDGALVIDMGRMRSLEIDPGRRRAWAGAGLTAGDYTDRAHAFGLATPFGDTASVGIAGLTLGGGMGYLSRRYGLTVDSLLSAELVTAQGRLVTASATDNPDLFWALRGGGGNFGVVTCLEFALEPVDTVYGGAILLPATRNVLRGIAPLAGASQDELTLIVNLMAAPPAPFVPAEAVGSLVLAVLGVFAGDATAGERAYAPIRSLATPVADTVGSIPYPAIYTYGAGASARRASMTRSLFLDAIDDSVVDTMLDFMERPAAVGAIVQIRILGGAIGQVPSSATSFAHRRAPIIVAIVAQLDGPGDPDERRAWATSFFDALRPRGVGAYVNALEAEGHDRVREAYPPGTYERLAAVKAAYDPDNMFRLNQNIRPAR